MDISKIDMSFIELFDLIYTVAKCVFEVEPAQAPAKTQKKIRKWVEKTYIDGGDYPTEVMHYIGKGVGNEDFFKFLKACHEHILLNRTHKKQLFDNSCAGLTEDVRTVLWALLEGDACCGNIRKAGADIQIDLESGACYDRTLTLINSSLISDQETDCLSFVNGTLVKRDGEYSLFGEDYDIRFTDARVDVSIYRADEPISGTPWVYLTSVASDILDKYASSDKYLNDREKELLPLIVDIGKLSYGALIPDEFRLDDLSCLKSYIYKFGYDELLPLFESLENRSLDISRKNRIVNKLIFKLNTQKYEPLWRVLRNIIAASQSDYLSKAAARCPAELQEARGSIQKLMESHGYSGGYPDFVKKGAIRGIRLAESYDLSYFVTAEKNVVYRIHCTEQYFDGHLIIRFICGTELLRKNETTGGIYSCLFNAKGRRFFKTVCCESGHVNADGEYETDDLEQAVGVAVKRAELLKLTKEERKKFDGNISYWIIFLFMFIVMGGLFSVFMTVCFMLIAAVCGLVTQPQAIPSIITGIPWWKLFLLAWILYGGAMGILTVLAKRK